MNWMLWFWLLVAIDMVDDVMDDMVDDVWIACSQCCISCG